MCAARATLNNVETNVCPEPTWKPMEWHNDNTKLKKYTRNWWKGTIPNRVSPFAKVLTNKSIYFSFVHRPYTKFKCTDTLTHTSHGQYSKWNAKSDLWLSFSLISADWILEIIGECSNIFTKNSDGRCRCENSRSGKNNAYDEAIWTRFTNDLIMLMREICMFVHFTKLNYRNTEPYGSLSMCIVQNDCIFYYSFWHNFKIYDYFLEVLIFRCFGL